MKTRITVVLVIVCLVVGMVHATVVHAPAPYNGFVEFNASYAKANATDGTALEYASQGGGTYANLDLDFASPVTIDRVIAVNRASSAGGDRFDQISYTFSDDSYFFDPTDVKETFVTGGVYFQSGIYALGAPITSQYVKWDVDTLAFSSYPVNTGVAELMFLNTPAGSHIVSNVTVSGAATASFEASYAVNGLIGYSGAAYVSMAKGADMFVDYDLGEAQNIVGFDYIDVFEDRTPTFNLVFSTDSSFGNADDVTLQFNDKGQALGYSAEFSVVQARYVRLDATSTSGNGNSGVNEMIFYAKTPNIADFNNDGIVNFQDYAVLARDWLKPTGIYLVDVNGPQGTSDGNVDLYDLMIIIENWLQ